MLGYDPAATAESGTLTSDDEFRWSLLAIVALAADDGAVLVKAQEVSAGPALLAEAAI